MADDDLDEDLDGEGGLDLDGDLEEAAERKQGGKGKLLLILIPVLLVIGSAAGAYFTGVLDGVLGGGDEADAGYEQPTAMEEGTGPAVFYELPEMLVNLQAQGNRQSFLKITVALEIAHESDLPRIETVLPRIVDNFQVYLRELRVEDLEGAGGSYRLREELLTRVNRAVRPARVNNVLFKEMLVQ